MANDTDATKVVGLLIEVANVDTVYRDLYLRRARQLLSATFDESVYRALGSKEKEIEDLMQRSRSAVRQRNWDQAAQLSTQAEGLRQHKATMANMVAIGKSVYDADVVAFDPFSPGKHLGAQLQARQPEVRDQLLEALAARKAGPQIRSILRKTPELFFQPGVGEHHSFTKSPAA
jgi:hypothetical protein